MNRAVATIDSERRCIRGALLIVEEHLLSGKPVLSTHHHRLRCWREERDLHNT